MNYSEEFATKYGLPTDLKKPEIPHIIQDYYGDFINDPGGTKRLLRFVTLSKDFWLGYGKLSDEGKAKMLTGLRAEAKIAQADGQTFVLSSGNDSNNKLLVTLQEFNDQDLLNIQQR